MKKSKDTIKTALEHEGVTPVTAEVGRNSAGGLTWHVTLEHPQVGLISYSVDFPAGTDIHASQTCKQVVERVVRALPPTQRGR